MRVLFSFLFILFFGVISSQASSVCIKNGCVNVDVVSEPKELQRGLQGRENLTYNQGMLFVFKTDDFQRFWMKDMKFAIDMIWIDNQRRIVTIAPSRPPCKEDPCEVYSSSKQARYVLEVASGYSRKHHLKEGDVVRIRI